MEFAKVKVFHNTITIKYLPLVLLMLVISSCLKIQENNQVESTGMQLPKEPAQSSINPTPQTKINLTSNICPMNTFSLPVFSPVTYSSKRDLYFDSNIGSDENTGAKPNEAWRSLEKMNNTKYRPGDVIHLKRGSTWYGTLWIHSSGTELEPIVFTSYGDQGDPPQISNPENKKQNSTAIKISADWIILENLKVQDAILAGIYIDDDADNNIIQSIEATKVGEGISVHGQRNRILGNYIHDLVMVRNTDGGYDDFGAVGVWLFNSNNEIAYNRIINCKAFSYDYDEDGGAVELFRDVHNSTIHHNYVYNTKGFMEIGGGSAYDNTIAYNIIVNSGRLLGLHLSGGFSSEIQNLRVENNTIVDTTPGGFSASILFLAGKPNPDMLILTNNIFFLENYERFVSGGTEFTHSNNLLYLPNGKNDFPLSEGEMSHNPKFHNLDCGDYSLQSDSPAIDAGIDLGYSLDYLLNPVFSGKAPDLGALEHQE